MVYVHLLLLIKKKAWCVSKACISTKRLGKPTHFFFLNLFDIKAMFVSRNSHFGKPLSKLSYICLPLGKLVNGKHFPVNGEHFPVNGEHFPVNEKHFRVKENFGLVSRKVFSLWLCLFSGKWFPGNHFPNFHVFVCH